MNHKNDSTNNVKAPEEKFIEAVTQKALEVLVAIRLIVHFDDTDGMNKRRIRRLRLIAGGGTDVTRGVGDHGPVSHSRLDAGQSLGSGQDNPHSATITHGSYTYKSPGQR
jgi:hypothetical protein